MKVVRVIVFWAIAALMISAAFAQTETGQITGTVTDPTGAVVPDAKVTVRNVDTGATRNTTTGASGVYVAPNLLPGTYQLTVEATGFTTSQRQVVVQVGSRVGADVALAVGTAGTTIEVSETVATVNTENQVIQQVVNSQQIRELPTITRNPYDLVGTVGNVSDQTPDARGAGYAINGQRAASTNILLDGTANNDEFTASVGQVVPLDSVQEFSVQTSNFTAEYGRATGGVVNVATRSGTNDFHGTLYEFNRLSRLASNEFDNNANGIPKPVFTRNQFGYSFGGPVVKDKLFFFSSTEWIRVRSMANTTAYVPTPELLNLAAPATRSFFQSFGTLSPNITPLRTVSRAELAAGDFDVCGGLPSSSLCAGIGQNVPLFRRISYAFPSDSGGGLPQNTYMPVFRVDYNLSDRTQMYARYALYSEEGLPGTNADSPYQGFNTGYTNFNNAAMVSVTHTFTPRLVSQSKVNFNRLNQVQPLGDQAPMPTLYLGSGSVATRILGNAVALPGYLPYNPGSAIPFGGPQNYLQFYEDLSYVHGSHQFRFGGMYSYLRDNRTFGAYQNAVAQFGTNFARGFENLLAGQLYQFQVAVDPQGRYPCGASATADCMLTLPVSQPSFSRSNRYHDYALYVQDAWKVTPRLTLNLGVRWEVFGTQHNKNADLDSNFYLGQGNDIFQQIASGAVMTAPDSPMGKLWKTDYNNFGPRLGFAWDPFGMGRTSLRGGWGIGYERNFGNVTFNVIQNPPNYAVISLVNGTDVQTLPVPTTNAGPLSGNAGTKALPVVSLRAVDPNIDTAWAQFWSGAVEHRFSDAVLVAVEYSGSRGEDQYGLANINRVGSGNFYLGIPCTSGVEGDRGDCTARLRPTQYSAINFRMNGGFSNYNGLNLRTDIRAMHGLTLRANYTWSHAIDTLSDTFSSSGNQYNLGWLDPFNPSLDKGDAYYDIRHRVAFSAAWDIGGPRDGIGRQVFGGWTIAPIFVARTGTPYSLYDCSYGWEVCPYAFANAAMPKTPNTPLTATATPNIYNYFNYGDLVAAPWFNPRSGSSDFGPFPGNMTGRNLFRTPGSWNLDMGLYKSFRFTERVALQVRGEAYNLFNHANLVANTGDADVSSSSFMSASFIGRRQIQLAAKIIF